MTTKYNEHSVEIIADEGMYLTDGKSYTTAVTLPLPADVSVWTETDTYIEPGEPIDDSEALDIITGQAL